MALIGREIVQSRVWIDPKPSVVPDLNYKYTYPITTYEAVKESMDEDSTNLKETIDLIFKELAGRQPIFPGRPANYLMTFAGIAGQVGGIPISSEIPWDPKIQSHDKIPTEKSVGDLLFKLGLVNEDGTIDPSGGKKTRWSDVIGRPEIYDSLGMNIDGVVIQKTITEAINKIKYDLDTVNITMENNDTMLNNKITSHTTGTTNPHNITIDMIGAASKELLEFHILNQNNPHSVTTKQLKLDKIDNTADMDKPISKASQEAFDKINYLIEHMTDDVGGLNFFIDGKYDQSTGTLTLIYRDGSTLALHIPIDGLVDEIQYDKETKELVVYELGGSIKRINMKDLFIRYIGSVSTNITVEITGSQETGDQIIKATINPQSITNMEMANDSVITRVIKDQNVTSTKIKDLAITTIKIADGSITTEKISDLSIVNGKITNRSIDGRTLFSSTIPNRILGVLEIDSNPAWMQINSDMLSDNIVKTSHMINKSITSDKLGDKSVLTEKIEDAAVTTDKLHNLSVTNEKVYPSTITGDKLVENPIFQGVPKITKRPAEDANNNEVPDTFWIRDCMKTIKIDNVNLLDRSVNGRVLFSSNTDDRALVVNTAGTDPRWGLINNNMMDSNAIGTSNIIDKSITSEKIMDKQILANHIRDNAVLTNHLMEDSVTSPKLFKSLQANRVLAAISENGNPVYSQITRPMIEYNAIGSMQIEDHAITIEKIQSSPNSNRLLGVVLKNTDPQWMQANNGMIGDRAINGRTLFTSSEHDVVLGVSPSNVDPAWIKINSSMIMEKTIKRENISDGAIWTEHLHDKIIESRHIVDWTIKSNNIAPGAITGIELFKSPIPNRVLGITTMPYSNPDWIQVTTDMIEDKAISRSKLFQSANAYRVLGVTQPNIPPEYIMINSDFIVDDSIIPNKLVRDFILYGNPEITIHPKDNSDNFQIADTAWVRKTISNIMKDFNPEILFDTIDTKMISNHAITGEKLFTHPYGPRVLGITHANDDVEFILIEENLIADGAVTTNKLQRDIHLLGNPVVEVRPSPYASDAKGNGQLVPDCQWVLDRIGSGGGDPQPGVPELTPGCITTEYLATRAVTKEKLFTSPTANKLLGVLTPNSNPEYIKVNNEMLEDRIIDPRVLFTSETDNRLLGVRTPNGNAEWVTINSHMLEDEIITTKHIVDRSITPEKILDHSITMNKLDPDIIMNESNILDESITSRKIAKNAVGNDKLVDECITANKLDQNIILPTNTSIESNPSYEARVLRNVIISRNIPTNANNGDIWFRYM